MKDLRFIRHALRYALAVVIGSTAACSGGISDLGGGPGATADSGTDSGTASDGSTPTRDCVVPTACPGAGGDGGKEGGGSGDGGSCALADYKFMVPPAGTISPLPSGTVIRLTLAYQGSRLAITALNGVTMTLPPSDPPLTPGVNAGYWVEVRDAAEGVLYTRILHDPTVLEGVGPDGGFTNVTVPYCDEKLMLADVPNAASAHAIVFFGSPYGTSNAATEIARFFLP